MQQFIFQQYQKETHNMSNYPLQFCRNKENLACNLDEPEVNKENFACNSDEPGVNKENLA